MMARGRDSAVMALMLLGLMLFHFEVAHAASFTVGDAAGWSPDAGKWAEGKKLALGDTLVFNYDLTQHDVVKVDKAGFTSCTPGNAQKFQTGKDEIVFTKGCNLFICRMPGCCEGGMKIDCQAKP